MNTREQILDDAPRGATHFDTGERCYLCAVNNTLYYMFPHIHRTWNKSNHKDGVAALTKYDYCVPLDQLPATL